MSILAGDADGGRGSIHADVLSLSEGGGADGQPDAFELTQKLMRLPDWIESALREAYATAEDSGSDDDDDDVGKDDAKEEVKDEGEVDDGNSETKTIKACL